MHVFFSLYCCSLNGKFFYFRYNFLSFDDCEDESVIEEANEQQQPVKDLEPLIPIRPSSLLKYFLSYADCDLLSAELCRNEIDHWTNSYACDKWWSSTFLYGLESLHCKAPHLSFFNYCDLISDLIKCSIKIIQDEFAQVCTKFKYGVIPSFSIETFEDYSGPSLRSHKNSSRWFVLIRKYSYLLYNLYFKIVMKNYFSSGLTGRVEKLEGSGPWTLTP